MNLAQAATGGPGSRATPAVRALAPYVIGKPIGELARELGFAEEQIVKLASNENPLGPSPLALQAMQQALAQAWLYPDGNGHDLKAALARRHGVDAAQVTLGNGSNDLLVLLAESFLAPGSSAVYSQYAFAIYGIAVQATGARHNVAPACHASHSMSYGHDLGAMRAAIDADTRLVYIANPNNPTGTWNTPAQLRDFLERVSADVIVALDEAYFEYSRRVDCPDGMSLIGEFANLVVLRTFSKAYGLAGVRVGYAISHPQIADLLNRVRQPFNVGVPGLVGALASLADERQPRRAAQLVEDGMAQLGAELPRLGVKLHPSAGNFVLAEVGGNAQLVYERLLHHGVIVRPVAGYGLPHALRITIGTVEQNERLIAALAAVLRG
ncbi:MAG TPA: histidinol-phosphate transaminase [Steroidobacteraceae bacterium]|nr:histidinol-phosphate transaminase [Steroidobacteraceae bacterium]